MHIDSEPMSNRLAEMKPYFAKDGVSVYCFNSEELIADIAETGGLVIADPPYGVAERTERKSAGRSKLAVCNDFPRVIGDDKPFDPSPWLICERLVLWGANHYSERLPGQSGWIIWDKRDGSGPNDNADAELAWTNLGGPARLYNHLWNGCMRASERDEGRTHPTQKPVALMRWLIEQFADDNDLIIDPYMGSGASLVAARDLGKRAIGFDLEERYCEAAARRLESTLPFSDFKYPSEKLCSHCGNVYRVVPNETFNLKASTDDGLQPWCRACDHRNKRNVSNGWRNFQRYLKNRNEEHLWTEVAYLEMMGDFVCVTCGAKVSDWSGGYWVDRISSKRGYIPGNCRPCCWGCNRLKSNRNPEAFAHDIAGYLARYGRGNVPWDELFPSVKHALSNVPDLSEYVVPSRQVSLPLGKTG